MATATGFAMFVSGFSHVYLWLQYAHTRPRFVQPDHGRVYALNTHGLIVYLTKDEQFRLDLLQWISITFLLCFFWIIAFRLQQKKQNQE